MVVFHYTYHQSMGYDCSVYAVAGIQLTKEEFYKLAQIVHPGASQDDLDENDAFNDEVDCIPSEKNHGVCLCEHVYLIRRSDERPEFDCYYLIIKGLGEVSIQRTRSHDVKLTNVTRVEERDFSLFCGMHGLNFNARYGTWLVSFESA